MQDNSLEKKQIRLQAFLAHCGLASRRACENIITDGRVSVNGKIVNELGTKVSENDVVCVDGKQISLEKRKIYVLLNKPAGYVCTQNDEKDRPVAVYILKEKYSARKYAILALKYNRLIIKQSQKQQNNIRLFTERKCRYYARQLTF